MRIAIALMGLIACTPAYSQEAFSVRVVGKGQPAMIFIPGLACSGDVWNETVDHFKARYECHVLTLAGFAGQKPVDGPFFDGMAKAIAIYIQDKKLNAPIVVGHSLGASLALKIAADHGEKIGGAVAVDGYVCTISLFMPAATDEQRIELGKTQREKILKQSHDDFTKDTAKMFSEWLKGDRLEQCKKWIEASDQKTVAISKGELFSLDLRLSLQKSPTPVLLLAGYNDEFKHFKMDLPAFEKKCKEQLTGVKNGNVAVHPNCKHFIMWDEPKWFYDQLEQFVVSQPKR